MFEIIVWVAAGIFVCFVIWQYLVQWSEDYDIERRRIRACTQRLVDAGILHETALREFDDMPAATNKKDNEDDYCI